MSAPNDDATTLLRRALLANATFSGLTGLAALLAAPRLALWLGLQDGAGTLRILGVGLLLFAATLLQLARADHPDPRRAVAISIADALWVVGSVVLLLVAPGLLSLAGRWAVALVAVVVAAFAVAQATGVRRMT